MTDPELVRCKVAEAYRSVGWVLDSLEEAALLSDVLLQDCPIIGATRGFTSLTGYSRDDLLGHNCRILLQGVPEVAISKSVRKNLRNFCSMCCLQSLEQISDVHSLQPNSRRDGAPFMNFIYVGRVTVHKHPYLLGVQRSVGDGLCARLNSQRMSEVAEESRGIFKRLRNKITALERATSPRQWSLGAPRSDAPPGFTFFSERLQDHCILLHGGRTAMRREPQELATNCLVFGNRPVRHTPQGLFFAFQVNDAVPTFEGLPVVGFTKRKPRDDPDLYPTVSRCLGASVLVGACGEAFARDQHSHFKIGFKPPPPEEVASWSLQPHLPAHKRRPPVGLEKGDTLGCMYTSAGHIQLWRNGELVLNFDSGRPIDKNADYYAVADVCLSAYCITILPMVSLNSTNGDDHPQEEEPKTQLADEGIDEMVSNVVNAAAVKKAITAVVADCHFCVTIADPRSEGVPLIAVSDAFEKMTGYARSEILGVNCRFLNQGCPVSPLDLVGLRIACESGTGFTALLPNRMKSGKMFINLLDLRGLTIARDAKTGEELWYLIGIQADVTGLSRESIPEDHLPDLQALAQMIREQLRKELSKLVADGWEDRQMSRDSSMESTTWELLEEPEWKCATTERVVDLASMPVFSSEEDILADVKVTTRLFRATALVFTDVSRLWGGRFPLAVIGGGALAFIFGLLFGRGFRRSS